MLEKFLDQTAESMKKCTLLLCHCMVWFHVGSIPALCLGGPRSKTSAWKPTTMIEECHSIPQFLQQPDVSIYLLTYSSRVLLEKLTSSQLVKKRSAFYGTRSSLPHSQVPTTCPYLSQIDPVHTLTSHFLQIHINIIIPSMPGSSKWSLSLRFPHQNHVHTIPLPHTCYMPRPSHSS